MTSASELEWAASACVQCGLGVGDGGAQLLRLKQRVRGRGVGGLLAGGGIGQFRGDTLDRASVALHVVVEVASPRTHLGEEPLRCLGGDARLALGRARRVPGLPRRSVTPGRERGGGLLTDLTGRDGVELLPQPLERRAALEQQGRGHPAGQARSARRPGGRTRPPG